MVAVCRGREIGADIEAIRPMLDAEHIADHNFSFRERRELWHLPPSQRLDGFFNAWTGKAAFLKATGSGLTHPLDDFDVSLAPGQPAALRRVGANPHEAARWSLATLTPAPDYLAAIAVQGRLESLSCGTWGRYGVCQRRRRPVRKPGIAVNRSDASERA